jgi:hypothetical protein
MAYVVGGLNKSEGGGLYNKGEYGMGVYWVEVIDWLGWCVVEWC